MDMKNLNEYLYPGIQAFQTNWQAWLLVIEAVIILALVLVMVLHKKGITRSFIAWVRPSVEGENKTASGRRLTAFAITKICYIGGTVAFFTWGFEKNIDPSLFLWKFALDILFIGLLWGFINQQTIVALKNGGGNFTTTKTETSNNTTTTTKDTKTDNTEEDK